MKLPEHRLENCPACLDERVKFEFAFEHWQCARCGSTITQVAVERIWDAAEADGEGASLMDVL